MLRKGRTLLQVQQAWTDAIDAPEASEEQK